MHRLLVLAVALLAVPAFAQDAPALVTDAPRLLHSAVTQVKGPDGSPAYYRYTTTYDPVQGLYVRTVEDVESGEVLRREVTESSMVGPTPDEHAIAQAIIQTDPEISGLVAEAEYPVVVEGGFVLSREEGHPCGPGSRCLQYDVFETLDSRSARRIRYVVVNLRDGSFVSRDFDPDSEGNLANPAMREHSNRRDDPR